MSRVDDSTDSPEIQLVKKALVDAKSLNDRLPAICRAMDLGMSMRELEVLLDWIDNYDRRQPGKTRRE